MSEELRLEISNPNEGKFLSKIEWNKGAFKDLVSSMTEQYKGMTYTEEQMKIAKNDRAKLNALKKAISERRIEVKNAVMAPYNQFEMEVKEVTALIDQPISMIDGQIKEYEERVKAEKKKTLFAYFAEVAAPYEEFLTFDKVFDPRYLNTSTSLKKAKDDILLKVEQVSSCLDTIEQHTSEKYRMAALDVYKRTLDMTAAFAEDKRLNEIDRKAEEKARAEAEQRKVQEAQRMAESGQKCADKQQTNIASSQQNLFVNQESTSVPFRAAVANEASICRSAENRIPPTESSASSSQEAKNEYTASFTIYGTKEQIISVKQYMMDNGIRFGSVKS